MIIGTGMGIPNILFMLALVGFACWKKGWIRVILAACIIIWGTFALQYDVKVAAPLLSIGSVLFFMAIMNLITKYRATREQE